MKNSALISELSRLRREEMMPIETANRLKFWISALKLKMEKQTASTIQNLIDAVIWDEEDNPYVACDIKDLWSN